MNNNTCNYNEVLKNFISDSERENASHLPNYTYKLSESFCTKLNERRKNQYNVGDVIVANVHTKGLSSFDSSGKPLNKRMLLLVISQPVNNKVIIVPMGLSPLFSSFFINDFTVSLGILPKICEYKIACADLSNAKLLDIDYLNQYINECSNGEEPMVFKLEKKIIKSVIRTYKNIYFNTTSRDLVVI